MIELLAIPDEVPPAVLLRHEDVPVAVVLDELRCTEVEPWNGGQQDDPEKQKIQSIEAASCG